MKVLIVNTSERAGGAAIAANRLMNALNNNAVEARMLVREKETDNPMVTALPSRMIAKWHFLWDRFRIFCTLHFHKKHLWEVDMGCSGNDITHLKVFQEADVIHLHWVNQGMLSLHSIQKILNSGKPVVWTMHDIWPATAICHLTLGCENFTDHCHNCRLLPCGGNDSDASTSVWLRKYNLISQHKVFFVACSNWLAGEARKSRLLKSEPVASIPNPMDTSVYKPMDRTEARKHLCLPADKKLILFAAQKVSNKNKGIQYLIDGINALIEEDESRSKRWGMIMLGADADEIAKLFMMPVYRLGYVSDTARLVEIYNAADVFVLPSLSENLPNTIMEAMACGTPAVGFRIGGIPEEIDNRENGYVAEYKNCYDLANGIKWILEEADTEVLSHNAIKKVQKCYTPEVVAQKYMNVYKQAIEDKKNKE